jgi:hypothetical protein
MSHREFNAQRTMLANAMATAGAELLEYMNVGSALAAIPNTEPPRYVVAGTLQMIAKLLPSIDAAPAAQAPSQVLAELTHDKIREIGLECDLQAFRNEEFRLSRGSNLTVPEREEYDKQVAFARAIEREIRAGSSDARDKALEEAAEKLDSMNDSCGDAAAYDQRDMYQHESDRMHAISDCAAAIRALKAESPAASKEGDDRG